MTDLHLLAYSAVLTWVMVVVAGTLRGRTWTPAGMRYSFSNRDVPPPPSALAERADRAAKNMLENLPIFTALLVAARGLGVASEQLRLGAELFFFARLAYFPCYLFGVTYLRSAVWYVSLGGYAVFLWGIVSTASR